MAVQKHGAAFAAHLNQQVANFNAANRVHAIGWLVKKNNLRIIHKRGRQASALTHAFGKNIHAPIHPF